MELILINDISTHYASGRPIREGSKDPRRERPYAEIAIPNLTDHWAVGLSVLSGFPIPDQEMDNGFPNEICERSKQEPPFAPFVVPNLQGGRGLFLCNLANARLSTVGVVMRKMHEILRNRRRCKRWYYIS